MPTRAHTRAGSRCGGKLWTPLRPPPSSSSPLAPAVFSEEKREASQARCAGCLRFLIQEHSSRFAGGTRASPAGATPKKASLPLRSLLSPPSFPPPDSAGSFANFAVASCALLTLLRGYLPALGKILLPSAGGLHAVPAMPVRMRTEWTHSAVWRSACHVGALFRAAAAEHNFVFHIPRLSVIRCASERSPGCVGVLSQVITATDFAPLLAALTAAIMAPGPAPALRSVPEQMVAIADALERIALHTAAHGAASVIDAATLMGVYNFLYKVLTAKPPPGGGLDELAEAILPIVGVLAVAAVDGGRTHFALVARRIKAMTAFVSRRAEAVINANENERGFKHPLRPILLEINDLAGIIGTPAGVLAGTPQAARALGLCNAALAAAQQRLSAAGRQKDQAFADSPDFGALVQDLRALQDTKAAARAVLVRICRLNNELAALPSTGGEALPSTGGEAPPPSQRLVQRRAALEAALAAAGAEFTAAEAAFNGLLPAGIAFAPASVLWGGPDWQGAWNAWRQGGAAAAVQRLIRPHARALAPALLADDPDAPAGSGPDELYKLQHWIDREERMVAALTAVIAGA